MTVFIVRIPDGRTLVERETLRDAKIAAVYESVRGPVEITDEEGNVLLRCETVS